MTEAVLEVRDLSAGYTSGLPILNAVGIALRKATITLIIGPNGAGKSTLIKAIAGLVPVFSGSITLQGEDIRGIRPDQMSTRRMAYIPQNDNIFRGLTIRQNLELVLRNAPDQQRDGLSDVFAIFPQLEQKQHDKGGALSGGQRQMLAIAMALAIRPSVILMDEPSAGLSPRATQEVLELAGKLTRQGVSILLVEQNVNQALRIADHCYILADGRNQLDGKAADLLDDPVVGEIYLGGKRVGST